MALTKRYVNITRKLWVFGSGTLAALLTILISYGYLGISVQTTGDISCGSTCESYFNISLTNVSVCFGSTFNGIFLDKNVSYELYKGDGRFRYDNPARWKTYNFTKGSCLERGRNHQFKLVGHKQVSETVKWGVGYGAKTVDPVWKGQGSSVFSTENPYETDSGSFNMSFNGTAFIINTTEGLVVLRPYVQTTNAKRYFGELSTISPLIGKAGQVNRLGNRVKFGWNITKIPNIVKNNVRQVGYELDAPLPVSEGTHQIGEFLGISYDDITVSGMNWSINSTALTINVSGLNDIIIDPTVFTTTTVLSNYPNQRKIFWDGSNWFVFYRSGTTIVYNFSSDLVSWQKGLNVITLSGAAAAARPDIVYKNISGWKTFFLYASMNSGLSQFNYSRGTINAGNGLNVTNNITVANMGQSSSTYHVGMSTTNYYFLTVHDNNQFAVSMSNRSLNADTGESWTAPETGFNISGGNLGSSSPASKFAELDNGDMMQVAKRSTAPTPGLIVVRNFTEQPTWSWSSETTLTTDSSTSVDIINDWDVISLNISGKLNAFITYVTNAGKIRLWQSDGARTLWNPVANMSTQAFAFGNGTVLSKNDTHLFIVYLGNETNNKTVYYRIYEPVSRVASDAFFIDNSTTTKKGLTVAEKSNGTDIAVGWTEVVGSTFTLVVANLTHASVAAGAVSDNNATLNVTLYTGSWLNATVNSTITVNASVLASGGNGHQVNGTVFFGQGNPIDQRINATQFGFPFYNTSQNFTCGFMTTNTRCDLNITINLTTIGAYWNLTINFTSNNTYVLANGTSIFRLNISDVVTAADSCSCPGSGNWEIVNGDVCTLTTTCNLGDNKLRIKNGKLRIRDSGFVIAKGGCFEASGGSLSVDPATGKAFCGTG